MGNKINDKLLRLIKSVLIFFIILVLWKITNYLSIWSEYILPPPEKVYSTFLNMINDGSIFINVYASMKRVLIGFAISTIIGVPLGIFFGIYGKVYEYFKSLINFLRNTPPLALIPMLILWFGIGEESKIIIIILASFFPIFTSTLKGIKNCDSKLIEVGRVFELSKLQIIFRIIIPNAILDIAVGLKLALGYSFRAIIGAELVAASSGLGYLISDGKEMSRTDVVIVGIIVIGLLGIITDYIFSIIVKKVSKGKMVEAYE
ncbi:MULTISPECIES: ABC transporter permease [unclassified Clostridioides]|uniref:ABC transporter permease n=1 Tax=unclassified Clostridioides TaxID=2635829 RepID=UPI001D102A1A|nr:ABC transporter permease [Clostridioides sp. ZZV15-6388]MCC0645309.1 ABC transporter permease [Clostridioides sp. ZZV14-6150]MCC0661613.1 ABC transporter permease [Clostridioides sp. ZZV14-6154]MCC0665500.1 ABC transporter permease [Clostridioides sp. ZZV15-6597]MCC0668986.1 ABC transporter permease [Clostridioides sp. ZZV14-6153]MCC0718198.1 ABC transporter permease [Clostridioides sp. ZZV14-6105]MCC0721539.1 ABC transporter permease [Clostridioides sp. ZZV14-6104]MCC0728518.1 ABC transp